MVITMMSCRIFLLSICSVFFLNGCAANIYKEDFSCPQMENGQCTSVENAHDIAIHSGADHAKHVDISSVPAEPNVFDKALLDYQKAVKSKDKNAIAKASAVLQKMYQTSMDIGRRTEQLEQIVTEEETRRAFLGAYADGQRMPGVRKPATLMETYILPYQTTEGALASERTIWIPVEEATWVWPDQFSGQGKGASIGYAD